MTISVVERVQFARALRSRPFAILWVGQTISVLGNGAFLIALAWEIILLTGSATAMSVVVIAQTVPMLLFPLIGGVAADYLPRRQLMLWSDVGRALIVLVVAGLGWFHLLQLWHLVVLSFCFGFVRCFFDPAYQAIHPQLVEAEALPSANALTSLSKQVASLLGSLLGVSFIALAGPMSAFAFDGLTFIISALCLFMVHLPLVSLSRSEMLDSRIENTHNFLDVVSIYQSLRKVKNDVLEGLNYVTGSKWLWISILGASVGNIGFAASAGVSLPKLVHDVYGAQVGLLGMLATAYAAGSIVATLVLGQLHRLRRRGVLAYFSLIIYSVALVTLGVSLPPIVAITADALVGFGLAAFDIIWITVMQELVPNDKLGRVSSIDALISFIFMPVGYALGGILTDHIGPARVFIAGGILNFIVAAISLCVSEIRQLE